MVVKWNIMVSSNLDRTFNIVFEPRAEPRYRKGFILNFFLSKNCIYIYIIHIDFLDTINHSYTGYKKSHD